MDEDLTIPEWQKEIVRERIMNFSEEDRVPSEIVKEQIRKKNKPEK